METEQDYVKDLGGIVEVNCTISEIQVLDCHKTIMFTRDISIGINHILYVNYYSC